MIAYVQAPEDFILRELKFKKVAWRRLINYSCGSMPYRSTQTYSVKVSKQLSTYKRYASV